MTQPDRLREILRRQRVAHQKLFDLQGDTIAGLKDVLAAVSRTQDEMLTLFAATNDLEDTIEGENK